MPGGANSAPRASPRVHVLDLVHVSEGRMELCDSASGMRYSGALRELIRQFFHTKHMFEKHEVMTLQHEIYDPFEGNALSLPDIRCPTIQLCRSRGDFELCGMCATYHPTMTNIAQNSKQRVGDRHRHQHLLVPSIACVPFGLPAIYTHLMH